MQKKNKQFTLSLTVITILILLSGCVGKTVTPASSPVSTGTTESSITVEADQGEGSTATKTKTIPTPTETLSPTATDTTEPTVAPTNTSEPDEDPNFSLTVLHTNDVHSHHEPNSAGDGGTALAANVINQIKSSTPNTLLLSAGDAFMGTLFYVMHHGIDSAELMNTLEYDAMTLGNHEFDEGDGNLALFIDELTFPVVAANVDFSGSSSLKDKTMPYAIIEKGGEKIGVIGVVNPDTPTMSRPGSQIIFQNDVAQIVQTYVDELTSAGINKIIVLSHIGYNADLELAQTVTGIDIIVGGHTHTLLANYDTRAEGAYPAEVINPEEKTVLVVQAGEYLEYLGKLDVVFDPNGDLVEWSGDTIYLTHYITPDSATTDQITALGEPIEALKLEIIGSSAVYLEGDRKVCRVEECNLGNLITDAMRSETGAQVALENGGGIRASIEQGDVSLGDVLTVLPFGNLVSTLSLSGSDLLAVLENGVSMVEEGAGRFLQVSGLRYQFDPTQPAGSRIVTVEVMDENGEYQPLDLNAIYTVATNDYLRGGGDGFTVMSENAIDPYDFGRPLDQILADYIKANSPIAIDVEGRISTR